MPTYFGIVAVLLVLSIAGYPIQAARHEVQIRALMAALTRRGVSIKATAGYSVTSSGLFWMWERSCS